MPYAVVLDTCVLFPMYLRDSLLRLAAADLYRPIWTAHILDELQRALTREQACSIEQAERIISLMRTHFPASEVRDYEPLIQAMTCHEKDRHVLAAAVQAGASMLATANTSDFPAQSTDPCGVEVISADDLLLELLDAAPSIVIRTLSNQAARYKREPTTLHGLLGALSRSGARTFADEARRLAT